ncbi:hypothetical protein AYI69_g3698 [Smittium culicis]|uniref:Uncharacterized protein n=1 Tax=Smittium culicis TaxID=133412 RepID=A0A1R1YJB1_9FUNG|nr:hypothetical protein AYI69_g3698 [Smittium culicis]
MNTSFFTYMCCSVSMECPDYKYSFIENWGKTGLIQSRNDNITDLINEHGLFNTLGNSEFDDNENYSQKCDSSICSDFFGRSIENHETDQFNTSECDEVGFELSNFNKFNPYFSLNNLNESLFYQDINCMSQKTSKEQYLIDQELNSFQDILIGFDSQYTQISKTCDNYNTSWLHF